MPTTRNLPTPLQKAVAEVRASQSMNAGVNAMVARSGELGGDTLRAVLAGIAMVPESRRHLDDSLDKMWARQKPPAVGSGVLEVVVGAGIHAAIYCAVRVAKGFPKPLVVEQSDRVGGAMAWSRSATFYLNSRNRPGPLELPGRKDGGLNVFPGAPLQPADLSADEYQRNDDLAYITRVMLAMNAKVVTGVQVTSLQRYSSGERKYLLRCIDGRDQRNRSFYAGRVVLATGLGKMWREGKDSENILSYQGFLRRMEEQFPLRGARRIAVLGAGDSGKTVIEALAGQGPATHWSVPTLDRVDRIDWYGVPETCLFRGTWEASNRSRYKGIGRLLPRGSGDGEVLVRATSTRAQTIVQAYASAYINSSPYDLVVDARGIEDGFGKTAAAELGFNFPSFYSPNGRQLGVTDNDQAFKVGPCACVPREDGEPSTIAENTVAMFRYASRTAEVAASIKA